MASTYTEIFKEASPLRGGNNVTAIAGGTFSYDGINDVLVSTTLTSVRIALITEYGAGNDAYIKYVSSNGMISISAAAATSGAWLTLGL